MKGTLPGFSKEECSSILRHRCSKNNERTCDFIRRAFHRHEVLADITEDYLVIAHEYLNPVEEAVCDAEDSDDVELQIDQESTEALAGAPLNSDRKRSRAESPSSNRQIYKKINAPRVSDCDDEEDVLPGTSGTMENIYGKATELKDAQMRETEFKILNSVSISDDHFLARSDHPKSLPNRGELFSVHT